jgi:hypothetical protein
MATDVNTDRIDAIADAVGSAKKIAIDARESLIELQGRSGNNGKVGRLREDVSAIDGRVAGLAQRVTGTETRLDRGADTIARMGEDIDALKKERRRELAWSGGGAAAGGGAAYAVIELLGRVLG